MKADRMPPFNIEAEYAALGSMLLDGRAIDEIRLVLQPDDFFRAEHQRLALAIFDLADAGKPVDAVSVLDWMAVKGKGDTQETDELLSRVLERTPHAANGRYYAEIVRQKATARRLIEQCETTLDACYAGQKPVDELLRTMSLALDQLAAERVGEVQPIGVFAARALDRIDRRSQGEATGVLSGLADLDDLTDGFQPGQLILLGARPSMGKTALALTIADCAAIEQNVRTLFVSLEMPGEELAERLLVMRAGVDGHALRTGRSLAAEEFRRLSDSRITLLKADRLWVDEGGLRAVGEIRAAARKMKRLKGLGLLILDYVGLLDPPDLGRQANRQEQVSQTSRQLKALARELGIPVLVLSQLSREPERRADKRPMLADLRESGALEQDADIVLLLHRPEFYNAQDRPGEADLIVAKHRNGPTGLVRLAYHKACTRFTDVCDVTVGNGAAPAPPAPDGRDRPLF